MREARVLNLSVVIPIPSAIATSCRIHDERVRLQDAAHHDTHNSSVVSDVYEDSACTEEEKVAVEQLAELRRIRDLSMLEDANDGCCSTESSFNTYDRKLPSLSRPPSQTCINKGHSSTSPATSSSAACGINLKHIQEQPKAKLKRPVQDVHDQDNIQVASSKYVTTFPDCDTESDNDGRLKPRSRLLSDIYCDHLNTSSMSLQPSKASKRRRKAINKIMAVGQTYVPEAVSGGKDHSTYIST